MSTRIIELVVGSEKDDAAKALTEAGYKVKVINVDGPPTALIENFDKGRVTLEVKSGKVVAARIG